MFNLPLILKDNLPIILGSVIMYIGVRLVSLVEMGVVLKLICELCVGVIIYGVIALITKNETCFMILEKVFGFIKRFTAKGKGA